MKTSRTVLAFGGVFVVSSGLLWGQAAMAYGQQWRPAAPAPTFSQHRIMHRSANMPNFRPNGAGYSAGKIAASRWQSRPMTSMAQPHSFRPSIPGAAPRSQGIYPPRSPNYRAAMPPRYAGTPRVGRPVAQTPAAAPSWVSPMMAAAPAWQPQRRYLPAPQFAWQNPAARLHPIGEPGRPAFNPGYPASAWRPPVPTAVMFRPHGGFSETAPATMRWRPVAVAPGRVYRQPAPRGISRSDRWMAAPAQPVWGGQPYRGMPSVSAASPRFTATVPGWRSEPKRLISLGRGFRPAGYGRSKQTEPRVAKHHGGSPNTSATTGLPGWATTYGESHSNLVCGWCNGS